MTAAFKEETVRLITEVGRPVSEISKELGIHINILYRWVKQIQRDQQNALLGKKSSGARECRNASAKKRACRCKEERDILKKW